jgi:hypothetical protein
MDGPRGKHTGNTRQPEGPHKALRREASERLAGRCDSADTCATIRGSANGGHDTCLVLTCLLRALYVARGSHVELTRRSRQRSAGSRGLYTGIKAYFRRADVSGSRSRATCETWRTSVVARSLFVFSYLDSARAETRDSREWRDATATVARAHICM